MIKKINICIAISMLFATNAFASDKYNNKSHNEILEKIKIEQQENLKKIKERLENERKKHHGHGHGHGGNTGTGGNNATQLEQLRLAMVNAETEMNKLSSEISTINTTISTLQASIDASTLKINDLQSQLSVLQQSIITPTNTLTTAQAKAAQYQSSYNSITQSLNNLLRSGTATAAQIASLQAAQAAAAQNLSTANAELATAQAIVTDLQNQIDQIQVNMQLETDNIATATATIQTQKDLLTITTTNYEKAKLTYADAKLAYDTMLSQVGSGTGANPPKELPECPSIKGIKSVQSLRDCRPPKSNTFCIIPMKKHWSYVQINSKDGIKHCEGRADSNTNMIPNGGKVTYKSGNSGNLLEYTCVDGNLKETQQVCN